MNGRRVFAVSLAIIFLLNMVPAIAKGTEAKGDYSNIKTMSVSILNPYNGASITYGVVGYPFTVRAMVYQDNSGGVALSNVCIRLAVDGNVRGDQYVRLPLRTYVTVSWTNQFATVGPHTVTVNANPNHSPTEYLYPPTGNAYADNIVSVPLTQIDIGKDYDNDGVINGFEYSYGTDMLGGYQKWAVLVEGYDSDGSQTQDFDQQVTEAYDVLVGKGYAASHICLRTPSGRTPATIANVQWAIQTWLAGNADRDDRVFVYLVGEGNPDVFPVNDGNLQAATVATWLTGVHCFRMTFVIEACYSGSWLDNIAADGRITISSAAIDKRAYNDRDTDWPAFSHSFFTLLNQGLPINGQNGAFSQAHDHANASCAEQYYPEQDPQMSDGIYSTWYP